MTWDKAARIRCGQIESGKDLTFNLVFVPYYKKAVKKLKPNSIIEIGSGTGHMAAKLSRYVNKYHAVEPSRQMYEVSKKVLKNPNIIIQNKRIEKIHSNCKYDLAISHQCLQTVQHIYPFLKSVKKLLKRDSKFIFSIPHPCFYNSYKKFFAEASFVYMKRRNNNISLTITKDNKNVISGIPYFHRPLEYYLNSLTKNGFKLVNISEIFPEMNIQKKYGKTWKVPRYLSICVSA